MDVNGQEMKPLEEYMLFTKTGSEKVLVANSQGIRTAQCAAFDVINKPRPGPSLNISLVNTHRNFYFFMLLCLSNKFNFEKFLGNR